MAIQNYRMQQKRGEEVNFDPDKMLPGEWAVSLDTKYVRMCFSPGVCVRMATYEAFEADMVKIQKILEESQTIEEAVKKIQEEINAKEIVIEQYVQNAKTYSETAANEADRATLEANRAKAEADRAQGLVGGDFVTHAEIVEYSLIKDTGYELALSIDESTYVMTIGLKNANGNVLSEKTIDFPIESMVVNATYKDGIITLVLKNGETVPVEVSDLVNGLVNNTLTIAGINLEDNITADELKQALGLNPLDSYEEISANTESGKFAGALGVKEGFEQLTDSLNKIIDISNQISFTQPTSGNVTVNSIKAWTKGNVCEVNISVSNSGELASGATIEIPISGLPIAMVFEWKIGLVIGANFIGCAIANNSTQIRLRNLGSGKIAPFTNYSITFAYNI